MQEQKTTTGKTTTDRAAWPTTPEAFARRLRNPAGRAAKALSDGLQAGLSFLGSLLPETGWTPPEGWDRDLGGRSGREAR